ncbi:MAG: DNA-binding protein WhiA [Clostridia bacterium]|nr:DNA-binding protein WhiA [Clostridia bacterium]
MSFTSEVIKEASALPIKKTCCRRAFTLGLFYGAKRTDEEKRLVSSFAQEETANAAKDLLGKVFRSDAEISRQNIAGRISYAVSFFSSGIADFLKNIDSGDDRPIHIAAGFRCEGCFSAFLRGVFIACGSVTDPQRSYHLELSFPTAERADFIGRILEDKVGRAGRIQRSARVGLYYKNNGAIADLLYFIGCARTGLLVTNSWIEHDIRNNENRATNCVARNISRSVDAAQKQISAIEALIETRKIDQLPEELRYTAKLRIENDSASLSELAMLHVPPITKSGLNGRLRKLMEAAKEE